MINIKNKKGTALIVSYLVITVLLILGVAFVSRSIVESRLAERQKRSVQAFSIAEAGLERTFYKLKLDFENDIDSPSWRDGKIDDLICGPDIVDFYLLPFASTTLGNGSYSVKLKNVLGKDGEICVESRGIVKGVSKTIRAYIKIEDISPWENVIFAGSGSAGTLISGNVDIRGSLLILGTGLESTDFAIDMSGDSNIGNNYEGMPEALKNRIPACPTVMFNGEEVESLSATVRIKRGKAGLSGSAQIGEPDVAENSYKETVDGVYITDDYGGTQTDPGEELRIYSDNGSQSPYDLGDSASFPSLGDPYLDDPAYTYQDYLRDNACVISDPAKLNQLAHITPNSNFTYGDASGSISMDGAGNLTINGIIYLDGGNLGMGRHGTNKTITYAGSGSIFVSGNADIDVNLLTPEIPGTSTFPANMLGIMTPNEITFDEASLDVMGVFYAENKITCQKQTNVAGVFVSNYFDMGQQVPSIYKVPQLTHNLPAGMISSEPIWFIKTIAWQKL